jgi:alcohol dehydrogenase
MANTMKAYVYHAPNQVSLDDVPVPQISDEHDVIIKVTLSAICTSDVHIGAGDVAHAKPPKILGHEFCGEIVELGSGVKGWKVGDRTVVNASSKCGECANCRKGLSARFCLTPGFGVFGSGGYDGCQAEYMKLPRGAVYMNRIEEGLTEEDVILVPDMLCTGWFGAIQTNITIGDTVVVIGNGPVGLSTCLAARLWGAKTIIAVDVVDYLLEAALKAGVADYTINSAKEDLVERVKELTKGKMAEVVIETVGLNQTFNDAIAVATFQGRVCSLALFSQSLAIPVTNVVVFKNLHMSMGIQGGLGKDLLLDYVKEGRIDPKFMLTHRAPLNDIEKGYDIFSHKKDGCIKWLVTPYER